MTKHSLLIAAVVLAGACSPEDGKQGGIGIAGSAAPAVPAGAAGTPTPAGSGAGVGASGVGAAGMASVAAGRGGPTAGAVAPLAGASGQAAAGTGASGTGMLAAGSGGGAAIGGIAGTGAAGTGAAGMAAAGMGAAGMGTPGGKTPGTVTVQFTTVSYGGEYAPLNYGAVWFEEPGGKFLKTAKRWAGTVHASDLVTWTKASGGWGSIFGGGGNAADMMDAMSSATIRTHQMHTVTWNMMDASKALVPDGEYVAKVEVTESRARDRAGPVIEIKFTKGSMPQTVEVPNQASFTGVVLKYTPGP